MCFSPVISKDAYMLVDGVLDNGLSFAASYLENKINTPVIITDDHGQVHYPAISHYISIQIPNIVFKREYYYESKKDTLYYCIRCNNSNAFIIVEDLPKKLLCQTIAVIREAKLAVKCYFTKIYEYERDLKEKLTDLLFLNSDIRSQDFVILGDCRLDKNKSYLVLLQEFEQSEQLSDKRSVCSYAIECFRKKEMECIGVQWNNYLLVILPMEKGFPQNGRELLGYLDIPGYKERVEKEFDLVSSLGIGRPYQVAELNSGFNEARVALTIPRLMGKRSFIQHFSDMGIYSFVFSQSPENIKAYCQKKLGQLIEESGDTDSTLLPTLRTLLDTGLSMKTTAEILHIHVNTLYYRINKIKQLLSMDFSRMDNLVELYIAIKVWDAFNVIFPYCIAMKTYDNRSDYGSNSFW